MSISVECPDCEKKLKAKEDLAGKRVKCPSCGRIIVIPAPHPPSPSITTSPSPGKPQAARRAGLIGATGATPPVPERPRLRWPWYAGGGAAVLCIVAVVVFLTLPGKQRTPANALDAAGPFTPEAEPKTDPTPKGGKEQAGVITADTIEQHLKAMEFNVPAGGSVSTFTVSPGGVMDGMISGTPRLPRPFGLPQKPTGNSFVQYIYHIENKKTGAKFDVHIESGRFFFFAPQSDASKSAMQDLLKRLDAQLPEKLAQLEKKFESAKTDAEKKDCREKLESIHLVVTSEGIIITSPYWPMMDSSFGIGYGLSDDGRTSLMIAAGAFQVDRVLTLLQKGADPKAKAKDGNTALHFLCAESHGYMSEKFGKIAAALIEKGADPNAKNHAGRVPLDVAHTTRNGEMAKFMRVHGAKW